MKRFFNNISLPYKITFVVLFIGLLVLGFFTIRIYRHRFVTRPSVADLRYGVTSSFKNASRVNCDYHSKTMYNTLTYKYTCTFDYKTEDEIVTNYTSCVDCIIKNKSWACSIGSSLCFK